MVAKAQPVEKIRRALLRISADAANATSFVMTEHKPAVGTRSGLGLVLSSHYLVGSVMMWIAYFMGLVVFYALINWMPILLKDAGIDARQATLISALFPLGGVGAVVFGLLMDRFNPNKVIAVGYALTAVAVFAIGQSLGNVWWLVFFVLVGGILMNTAQSSMPALAAHFYPTQGRGTGVAWMLGIGRFGGIAGSFLVAELTRRQVPLSEIFTIVAIAGVIATIALIIKHAVHPETGTTSVAGDEVLGH
jgi:AAHS family 4-hydroxybenzoate transporter-like MFS transporter